MIDRGVLLVLPRNCSISPSSTLGATSASNLLHDEPALVWRSQGASGANLAIEQSGTWDVIGLVGTNFRPTDQIRVRAASTLVAVTSSPAIDQTIPAYEGVAKASGGLVLFRLATPVSHQFIRIDITSLNNPDGYLEVSNLVLGLGVEWAGVDAGAEITYDNPSASYLRKFRTKPSWKIILSGITTTDYYDKWEDFLLAVAERRGFLFVPVQNDTYLQKRSAFVSIANAPKITINSSNDYTLELQVSTIQ